MGVINRAVRNISRRKIRALLVIIALGFSLAIMISIPAGVLANQQTATNMANDLSSTINQTSQSINATATQIDCTISSGFSGFGFTGSGSGSGSFTPGQFGQGSSGGTGSSGGFGGFGGGGRPGMFGGGAFGMGQGSPMNESLYTDINSTVPGIAAVEPILQVTEGQNQPISRFGRSFTFVVPDYYIEGIPLTSDLVNNYSVLPTNITEGRNLQAGDSGVVVLSENNSAYFGVGVGGSVNILGQSFTVVGIHGTSGVSDRLTLYMNLSDAQALTSNVGYITDLRVFAQSADVVSQVATSINSLHPELQVTTAQDRLTALQNEQSTYTTALANAQSSIDATQTTAVEEIIIVVAATSLIVLFVMLYTVRERTKEIGTLKAIGFSSWTVMGQFMLEGVLLSMIAGLVGIAIGFFAAPTLSSLVLSPTSAAGNTVVRGATRLIPGLDATATLNVQLMLLGFAAAIALGALGSLYPAWRAAKIRPAEAMKYE
ncbi:MAG: ABC transporter permease [Gammaproteobacteria bacterium]|nr:ABC transporter permease [Gammaproteobacteria bacterium]